MGTCLVTGGAGFIGSNLVDRLIQDGHQVLVVDDLSSGKEENVHPEAKLFCPFDIRKDSFVKTKLKIDVIYHLAAMSRIADCKDDPAKAMDVNVQGTVQVLEMARVLGSRLIYAGSSCAYWPKYSNVYAYSKSMGEEHCRFYSKHYGVPTLIARFFNVYGPRCPRQGPGSTVVGIFERQKAAGEPLTVTGNGRQRRDFIHVYDIVDGLVRLYNKTGYGEHYDFGSSYSYGILEIARMFAPSEVKFIDRPDGEAEYTRCYSDSLDRAWKDLGWEPKIHIQQYISDYLNELARNAE